MDEGRYLYCIVSPDHPPPSDLSGLEDREVRRIAAGRIVLWASRLEARPSPSLDRIRRHNEVVEAAMGEAGSPVPIRFGEWFPTREELLQEVGEREEAYARSLEAVRGAVELGVRITDPARRPEAAPDLNARTGREYMEGLARTHAEARAGEERGRRLGEALASHLGPLARRQRVEHLPAEEGLVSVAHLVDREDVERYRRAVAEFADGCGELRFRVSGPWPPYSFVE